VRAENAAFNLKGRHVAIELPQVYAALEARISRLELREQEQNSTAKTLKLVLPLRAIYLTERLGSMEKT